MVHVSQYEYREFVAPPFDKRGWELLIGAKTISVAFLRAHIFIAAQKAYERVLITEGTSIGAY